MKLKSKIRLYATVFLIVMLLLFNTLIAVLFISISIERQKDNLREQSFLILENNSSADLLIEDTDILIPYTPDKATIQVMNAEQEIVVQNSKEEDYSDLQPSFAQQQTFTYNWLNRDWVLTHTSPISQEGERVGILTITQSLEELIEQFYLLLLVLIGGSIVIILLSVIAANWLSNLILKPISLLSSTMKTVEQSGEFQKIPFENETHDELQEMGEIFNRMIDKLEQNQLKQQQFLLDASHELKTPITIIESYSSMLKRRNIEDADLMHEAIDTIHNEALTMKSLTNVLLDLTDEQSLHHLEKQPVELVSFCEKIIKKISLFSNRLIRFHPTQQKVTADIFSEKIEQVIIILLDNALKYSSDHIDFSLVTTKNNKIMITITDYGIGISEQDLPLLFDRFYRVDSSRSKKTGGHGLGLSIAQSTMELVGGDIYMSSKENEGTKATIVFDIL